MNDNRTLPLAMELEASEVMVTHLKLGEH